MERAVAERERTDFNAGVVFDLQRLGAHGLGDGVDSDGAAVNGFFLAVGGGDGLVKLRHVSRDVQGLDRLERDRADGNVAARDRLCGVGVLDLIDRELGGFSLDGMVVGGRELLLLFFGQRAEELLEVLGVVVLSPLGGVELDLVSIGDVVVDLCKGGLDEAHELFNLEGRRHLEGRRIEREAAERQGRRIAMVAEVGNLVVFNRELGVVVDRDGAELGDIPRTILFRFGIAFGAGLGSGGFYFPVGRVVGERDGAIMVVAVVDLAVLTLLEGLSLAEGEGGAGGEVLVFGLGEAEGSALSEGAHGEALVDGERAAFGHGNEVADLGGVAGVIAVLEVVGGEGTLVADGDGLFLLGVDGAPGGLAVDLGRAGTSILGDGELGAAVKSAFGVDELAARDRQVGVGLERARVDKGAVDRDRLVGFDRAVVDERAAFSDVKADVERQAGKFVGELASSLVVRALADRDRLVARVGAFVDRDRAGGVREFVVELLGPSFVPGLFVLDRARDGLVGGALGGADGQLDIRFGFFGFAGHGACGEDGERGQNGRDERLPGEGGVAH